MSNKNTKSRTRVLTSGSLVTLRARKSTDGKNESLYLDYYSKGKRIYKFLKIYLFVNPKTETEKKHNEDQKRIANELRTNFESELMSAGTSVSYKINTKFIPFMEYVRDRKNAKGESKEPRIYNAVIKILKKRHGESFTFIEINDKWLNDLKEFLLEEYEHNTAATYFSKVSATIKRAIKDKVIKENPLLGVDPIQMIDKRFDFLDFEELQKLKATRCDNEILKRAALTAAMTGLRACDLKQLRWKQIRTSTDLGNYIVFKQEKTGKETFLPIKESVLDLLGERSEPDDCVFPGFDNDKEASAEIRVWLARAEIEKEITFHDFRHTHAILLGARAGANLYEISKMLGHKSIKTTEKYYADVIDETKRRISNNLPDL